jgi:beta-glucosidase
VAQSQVVLKNAGNVLPIARNGSKVFVAGKNAANIGNQSGGFYHLVAGRSRQPGRGHHDPPGHRSTTATASVRFTRAVRTVLRRGPRQQAVSG